MFYRFHFRFAIGRGGSRLPMHQSSRTFDGQPIVASRLVAMNMSGLDAWSDTLRRRGGGIG